MKCVCVCGEFCELLDWREDQNHVKLLFNFPEENGACLESQLGT